MKILTVGGATRDIFIDQTEAKTETLTRDNQTDDYLVFREGSKIEVKRIHHYTGGGATNSAASFKHLGHTVSACFKVGNDRQGELIIRELEHLGITTNHSLTSTDIETAMSFIIRSASHNDTILAFRGSNTALELHELPLNYLSDFDMLYITSLSGPAAQLLVPLAQAAKKQNIKVAVNPGSSQLTAGAQALNKALPFIDIFILNMQEAQTFWSSRDKGSTQFDLPKYFEKILAQGPSTIVVTDGAQGVHAATKEETLFQPSIPTKVVSTVGAGDSFGSCFSAHILSETPLKKALLYGVTNSSSVISQLGAKSGLLTQAELDEKL